SDVRVARQDSEAGHEWVASHDGYRRTLGALHTRRLLLSNDGTTLTGEDEIALPKETEALPAVARFHLHPGIRASLIREGESALLALPSGEVWEFEASGLVVTIEESIFLAAADGKRRTEQLAIHFDAAVTPQVTWQLTRVGTAPRATRPHERGGP
ncbi:heparinase II/III domain-containing protein, partial [Lysobacter sp. TAB13]